MNIDAESAEALPGADLYRPITRKPTGIPGFDEISNGGLPEGRLIGIMGGPGTGKTIFALHTLVSRAHHLGENGVFVSFEEPTARLRANAGTFTWDFQKLDGSRVVLFDGRLPPDTLLSGDFDLGGLLAQVAAAVERIGASIVVFDALDILLTGLSDIAHERRELLRIDQWALDRSLTCIITCKSTTQDVREVARADYMHYLTDMVVELDGRIFDGAFTRVLRIVKYRGSDFLANAYPAVITAAGIQVIAKTEADLDYPTFEERLGTGVAGLDALIEGGYRRGTTVLVTGAPGTTKTSMAGQFALAACNRGETVVYVSFDESATQIVNDLRTVGIDLEPHRATGKLALISLRSASRSPDSYYVLLRDALDRHSPSCFIIDPISALIRDSYPFSRDVCEHLLDEARGRGITTFCTWLTGVSALDQDLAITTSSTIADTWLHLTYNTRGGERNRALTIVKSRGTHHSNQVRELTVGKTGLALVDVYTAEGEVLMGSARAQRESSEQQKALELGLREAAQEFELTQALATLEMQQRMTAAQLDWKRKELGLLTGSSSARLDGQKQAAARRLRLRQPLGDKQ
jgi:circadian clock protein KaiC